MKMTTYIDILPLELRKELGYYRSSFIILHLNEFLKNKVIMGTNSDDIILWNKDQVIFSTILDVMPVVRKMDGNCFGVYFQITMSKPINFDEILTWFNNHVNVSTCSHGLVPMSYISILNDILISERYDMRLTICPHKGSYQIIMVNYSRVEKSTLKIPFYM